jgi:hypothetical protein
LRKETRKRKNVITVAASDKDCMLEMVSKLRPERYNPTAQIKRMPICFKIFVFIIGENYKLLILLNISKLQQNQDKILKKKSAVVCEPN